MQSTENVGGVRVYVITSTAHFKWTPNVHLCDGNLPERRIAHKNNVRETSLFTETISNKVRKSQATRLVSVPGQILEGQAEMTAWCNKWRLKDFKFTITSS